MTDRQPNLLDLLDLAGRPAERPKGMVLGWRNTNPDLISRDDFQWAWPGSWTHAPNDGRDLSRYFLGQACPSRFVGGICVAKTWNGAASGGVTSAVCLIVAYRTVDVLGETFDKIRVCKALSLAVIDTQRLIRSANLRGANLRYANLRYANLRGANLSYTNLSYTNLSNTDLSNAHLRNTDLSNTNLRYARGDRYTTLPSGYKVNDAGLIVRSS